MSRSIVVVEDDPGILELLQYVFESEGIHVTAISRPDVRQIRESCSERSVVLIDLMLPGMSGVELARQLQNVYPDVSLIAMSASRLALQVAQSSGLFVEELAKPFNIGELLECVERHVDGSARTSITESAHR